MSGGVIHWLQAASRRFSPQGWERLEASALARRVVRGAFWSVAGAGISRGLALLASIVVARIVGQEAFGDLGMVQTSVVMFSVFAGFGLGVTATKFVAEYRTKDPARAGRIIALASAVAWVSSGLITLAVLLLAPLLARQLTQSSVAASQLEGLLRISSLLLLLGGISGAQSGVLAGFESFKVMAGINMITGLVCFPLTIAGTWWWGVKGAVWALVITAAAGCWLNHRALRREAAAAGVSLRAADWPREWPILWRFSLPAVLANLLAGPVNGICGSLLYVWPNGPAEMGIFNAANQWFSVLLVLPSLLGQAVLPIMSERLGVADNERSLRLLRISIGVNALVAAPMLVLAVASPLIMRSYGRGFEGGAATLVIVLVTAGLLAVQTPVGQIIVASGKIWPGLLMNAGWATAYLVATGLLVNYGAVGLATARLIAYCLHAFWTFRYALRLIRRE